MDIRVTITLTSKALTDFPGVSRQLAENGFHVRKSFEDIGIIFGDVDVDQLSSLRQRFRDVAKIETESSVQLRSPSSDIQ
jgi:hypothetical protein